MKNVLLKVKGKEIYKSARYLVDVERLNNCSTNVSETFLLQGNKSRKFLSEFIKKETLVKYGLKEMSVNNSANSLFKFIKKIFRTSVFIIF